MAVSPSGSSYSKETILPSSGCPPSRSKSSRKWLSFGALAILTLTIYSSHASVLHVLNDGLNDLYASLSVGTDAELCPQTTPLFPSKNGDVWGKVHDTYSTDDFKMELADWLGGAIRIPCV